MTDDTRIRTAVIVDDSRASRAAIRAMLEGCGWAVTEATDGESAASIVWQRRPEVIICDHMMAGISGTQLCRLLRQDERTADVPVVILTAGTTRRGQFWAMESGASGYLSKSELGKLPAMLARIERDAGPRARSSSPSVEPGSVASRLGHLLDATLFETVISGRLRGMASLESTARGLFQRLGELLQSVLRCRWLALALDESDGPFVLHHPEDDRAAREALDALGLPTDTTLDLHVGAECDRTGTEVAVRSLDFGGKRIGQLAIGLSDQGERGDDLALFELIARDLPPSLRLVLLLEQTQRLALTDTLTGIGNRRAGLEFLERFHAAAQRHHMPLAAALVDVDHFKRINDRHGHETGDRVLKQIATMLATSMRRADAAVRWGGEEFLLVFPQTGLQGARLVCERLRMLIERSDIRGRSGERLVVTVSIGVASQDERGVDAMLLRADAALYEAKERGRNRVMVDGPDVT
jgi:two-component system cell cycle response regulator